MPEFPGEDPWKIYDTIERRLLDNFFQYVRENLNHALWVHWKMSDINYGFFAIEHRYEVLGGTPICIQDAKKFDLVRILVARYGKQYAGHPRLQKIMSLNGITDRDFLVGADEATAFRTRNFLDLHRSTLRKVDVFSNLLELAISGKLKTEAPFWDRNGGSLRLAWEKYIWTPIGWFVSILLLILTLSEWVFPDAKIWVAESISSIVNGDDAEQDNSRETN